MKILSVFIKSMKENFRSWQILILTITFAPFFVLLMYSFYGNSSISYNVMVCNQDQKAAAVNGGFLSVGDDLVANMKVYRGPDGKKVLNIIEDRNLGRAKKLVQNKEADILLVIPADFSEIIKQSMEGMKGKKADLMYFGNMTNAKYIMAAIITDSFAGKYVSARTNIELPIRFNETFLEKNKPGSDFDFYVPGLIILSVIMILFTASASLIKEVDKETIKRLQISKLSSLELLTGIGLVQVIITAAVIAITLWTANLLGFKSAGSIFDIFIIGLCAGISVVAISLIVSSFLKTIFDLMTIGCFPFFILMFFSGGMFPLPQMKLFNIGSLSFNITDILPTSHAVSALNKIMNFGANLYDVSFEIMAILVLTFLYFLLGVQLFQKRHMKIV